MTSNFDFIMKCNSYFKHFPMWYIFNYIQEQHFSLSIAFNNNRLYDCAV
jgi:hypothetical protein